MGMNSNQSINYESSIIRPSSPKRFASDSSACADKILYMYTNSHKLVVYIHHVEVDIVDRFIHYLKKISYVNCTHILLPCISEEEEENEPPRLTS